MTLSAPAASERWRLPGTVLPEGEQRAWYAVDGMITTDDPGDANDLPGQFVLPGLVDAHLHLFLRDMKPVSTEDAMETLRSIARQGVLAVRDMGAPGSRSLDLPRDSSLADVLSCGRQLAVTGGFFPGSHDPVDPARLVEAALGEVAKGASWVKVLTDWSTPDLTFPLDLVRQMVDAVHAAGARVAAHSQWAGVRQVALTGVDSIEHGYAVDEETLGVMAERGIAWAPTAGALERGLQAIEEFLEHPPSDVAPDRLTRVREIVHPREAETVANVRRLVPLAVNMGVRLLASTDNAGRLADEVGRFTEYGLDPVDALRAATTTSRSFLGLPGIDEGAPADVVTYDEDPRIDVSVLHRPASVVLKGHRIA